MGEWTHWSQKGGRSLVKGKQSPLVCEKCKMILVEHSWDDQDEEGNIIHHHLYLCRQCNLEYEDGIERQREIKTNGLYTLVGTTDENPHNSYR